jgi:hypothetical protein
MSLENIIKSLENGICPLELNYKPREEGAENIDWDKVLFNLKYHQPEFYEKKFPKEIHNIPAFDKVINLIVEKNADNSPLKEMMERQEENIINIYEPTESNTST